MKKFLLIVKWDFVTQKKKTIQIRILPIACEDNKNKRKQERSDLFDSQQDN